MPPVPTTPATPAPPTPSTPSTPSTRAGRRVAGDRRRAAKDRVEPPTEQAEVLSSRDVPVVVPEEEPEQRAAPDREPASVAESHHRPRWVVGALAVCLVAVLAACVLAAVTTRRDRSDQQAGTAALAAAKAGAATILSYDYRHLDTDFAAAAALSTGSFRTDYQATTAKAVRPLATQTHAVVVAKVVAGGVVSSSVQQVTVLLFVNQTTTSNRLPSAKTDLNRVQMTMTRSGSHWLVSALKAL